MSLRIVIWIARVTAGVSQARLLKKRLSVVGLVVLQRPCPLGAFYGQEVLGSGLTVSFEVVMQGSLERSSGSFVWYEGEDGV